MASAVRFATAPFRLAVASTRSTTALATSRSALGAGTVRALSSAGAVDPAKSKYVLSQTDAPYTKGKHRSNALGLIQQVPVIEVEGDMAVCDGGGGALGHPLEYIKIGSRGGEPVSCIYCGLRYKQKGAH